MLELRRKRDNKIMNVSYTEFGLRFTTDNLGRKVYWVNNDPATRQFNAKDYVIQPYKFVEHPGNREYLIRSELHNKYKANAMMNYIYYENRIYSDSEELS